MVYYFLITLWTEKHHRLNPGKTVVKCLEIFPGSAEFHGKHVSVKNKHFQNSCKFVENFLFFGRLQIPRPPTVYFPSRVSRKTNSHACQNTLFFLSNFFFIHFRKKPTEIALRIERTLNNLIVMCRLIMLKRKEK